MIFNFILLNNNYIKLLYLMEQKLSFRKKYCGSFWSFLANVDLFAISPASRITFRNEHVYSSFCGKIMTLSLMSLFIIIFLYFGINMMTRASPNTIVSDFFQPNPDYLNITKENFFMAFGMREKNTNNFILDERYYTPTMSIVSKNKSNTSLKNISDVLIKPCDDSYLPLNSNPKNYFQVNPITNMSCIADYTPVEMLGSDDIEYYEYIKISFTLCDNSTSNVTCKTNDEMIDFLIRYEFYVTFTSYSVNSLNYENPYEKLSLSYYIPTLSDQKIQLYFQYQHLIVNTDAGLIFKNPYIEKGMTKTTDKIYYVPQITNDSYFDLIIQLDKVVKTYERQYDKLQNVLASSGGAFQVLLMFAIIITKPVVSFHFYRDLANDFFEFEIPQKQGGPVKKLHINLFQYIYSFFSINNEFLRIKRTVWENAKSSIDRNLSLNTILVKIAEIEKIKFLIFDDTQLVLFNQTPKPYIYFNDRQRFILDTEKRRKNKTKWDESLFVQKKSKTEADIQAFSELVDKDEKSGIDKRIIEMIKRSKFGEIPKKTKQKTKMIEMSGDLETHNQKLLDEKSAERTKRRERKSSPDENFNKVLDKSDLGPCKNDKELTAKDLYIFIDTTTILKDLDSLKKTKK